MIRAQFIGCGAAGNKCVIDLVESRLMGDDMSYLLVNSTSKDIPAEYKNNAMIFGNGSSGGCGKERELGKKLILEDKENGIRSLDKRIDPFADVVIVCGSTEGGSGSASIPIISKYVSQVLHIPCIAVLFFGFNSDARGMQNSIEICQELEEDIGVIAIRNSSFLEAADGNKIRAEKMANQTFCHMISELCGREIRESSQNIDDTDLKKVVFTPGYMIIDSILLKNAKNANFNKLINNTLDESCSMLSPTKSAKRIALIFNVKPNNSAIDYSGDVFKERFGVPYELFTHIQDAAGSAEYVTVIAAGMDLPLEEVKEIFEEYKRTTSAIKKDQDSFFDELNSMKGDPRDSMFNMFSGNSRKETTEEDRDSFFKSFNIDKEKSPSDPKHRVKDVSKDY